MDRKHPHVLLVARENSQCPSEGQKSTHTLNSLLKYRVCEFRQSLEHLRQHNVVARLARRRREGRRRRPAGAAGAVVGTGADAEEEVDLVVFVVVVAEVFVGRSAGDCGNGRGETMATKKESNIYSGNGKRDRGKTVVYTHSGIHELWDKF